MHAALKLVAHRPWRLPARPWIMEQTWNDLLFAHWPVSFEILRALVPAKLLLDTFEGQAWVAVTPFHMTGIRARWFPPLPRLSRFAELNVRTYVTYGGKPGVYFFSLDAASLAAVSAARATYRLPYFYARMKVELIDELVKYHSIRNSAAEFRGSYHATTAVQLRQHGTLEHWLTERYCLYAVANDSVFRAEIHHEPCAPQRNTHSTPSSSGRAAISLPRQAASHTNAALKASLFHKPKISLFLRFDRAWAAFVSG